MTSDVESTRQLERRLVEFYEKALVALTEAEIPFLVGGHMPWHTTQVSCVIPKI